MNYEDLPAALKRRVDAAEGRAPKKAAKGGGSRGGGGARWQCATCDEILTTWAAVDRHDPKHGRVAFILTQLVG